MAKRLAVLSTHLADVSLARPAANGGPFPVVYSSSQFAAFQKQIGVPDVHTALLILAGKAAESLKLKAALSDFYVGAAVLTACGDVVIGGNLEVEGGTLGDTIHGEQCAIHHCFSIGYRPPFTAIAINAFPCGHCRQFMTELEGGGDMKVIVPQPGTRATEGKKVVFPLRDLLPNAFTPAVVDKPAMGRCPPWPLRVVRRSSPSALVDQAMKLCSASQSSWVNSPGGVVLRDSAGRCYGGMYLEAVAFNMSINPVHGAISLAIINGAALEDVVEAAVAYPSPSHSRRVDHLGTAKRVLGLLCPNVQDIHTAEVVW